MLLLITDAPEIIAGSSEEEMPSSTIIRLDSNPEGFGETADDLTEELFESSLPTQHSHEYFADDDLGLYVGVWDTDEMIETAGPYACDEFMWLIEGEAEIKNSKTGTSEKAKAGDAFIIPKAYNCQWLQKGYLRKFFVIYEHPEEPLPDAPSHEGIIIPKADTQLTAITAKTPFALAAGATATESICYTDNTSRFVSGTWHSEAFEAPPRPFPHHEFFLVHDGSIYLTDEAGVEHVFTAGEAFFIPQGVICSAQVSDSVTIFFARLYLS
ncbi:MAG: putative cupin superfamily protein [Alcanivorax sp.]